MRKQHDMTMTRSLRFVCLCSLILIIGLLQGCKSETGVTDSSAKSPIAVQKNNKYQIDIEFYGEKIGADSEPQNHMVVDSILIRDRKSGKVEQFVPEDAETLQSTFGYFTKVWSSDEEYLALPLGRFQGFVFFTATTVMEKLPQKDYSESIQIKLTSNENTKLWHEFVGWEAPHNFHFSAGLSGEQTEFVFDPASGKAYAQNAEIAGSFNSITNKGISALLTGKDL